MGVVYVVGAGIEGQEGFSARALGVVRKAQVIYAAERLLNLFADLSARKVALGDHDDIAALVQECDGVTVVLTSGDPLFFSIGRSLLRNIPRERLEFIPNVSSVQFAFARIKQPWDDAVFISTSGRPMVDVVDRIVANDKAAILTDSEHTPAQIAAELVRRGRDGYTAWLCENLGSASERIVQTDVAGLRNEAAAPLNVVILIKSYDGATTRDPRSFGIADVDFATLKKQMTSEEVRAVVLAKLRLHSDMTLWDVGAGSGSVSIEADYLLPHGRVYAIERNEEYLQFLRNNLNRFNTRNVRVVAGEAPQCLDEVPDPDRVFIGGSGGNLWELLNVVDGRLGADGRVVMTATTLDTLVAATDYFENAGYQVELATVNVAVTNNRTDYRVFEARNPVYVIVAVKEHG